MELEHYVTDRQRALQRWSQRIDELLCRARELPSGGRDLQCDLQGLRDKRDEVGNRLTQLALAPAGAWRQRQRELDDSWLRMVRAWNSAFRKLQTAREAVRAPQNTPHS